MPRWLPTSFTLHHFRTSHFLLHIPIHSTFFPHRIFSFPIIRPRASSEWLKFLFSPFFFAPSHLTLSSTSSFPASTFRSFHFPLLPLFSPTSSPSGQLQVFSLLHPSIFFSTHIFNHFPSPLNFSSLTNPRLWWGCLAPARHPTTGLGLSSTILILHLGGNPLKGCPSALRPQARSPQVSNPPPHCPSEAQDIPTPRRGLASRLD